MAEIKPATEFKVTVRTDPKAKVALAAVDSAVYILNKNKLSLQKVIHLGLCIMYKIKSFVYGMYLFRIAAHDGDDCFFPTDV